jgi:hypothetical protein
MLAGVGKASGMVDAAGCSETGGYGLGGYDMKRVEEVAPATGAAAAAVSKEMEDAGASTMEEGGLLIPVASPGALVMATTRGVKVCSTDMATRSKG